MKKEILSVKIIVFPAGHDTLIQLFNPIQMQGWNRRTAKYYNNRYPFNKWQFGVNALTPFANSNSFDAEGNFLSFGNLADYLYITGVGLDYCTMQEWFKTNKLTVEKIRLTCSSPAQLIQDITIIKQNIYGEIKEDIIKAANFINPMQVQPDILDIPVNLTIDGFTGLDMNILNGTLQLAVDFHIKTV